MRFRFCGDLDCPDWVLAEINTLSKMVVKFCAKRFTSLIAYCDMLILNLVLCAFAYFGSPNNWILLGWRTKL